MIYIISDRTNGRLYRALTVLYNEHRSEEDRHFQNRSSTMKTQIISKIMELGKVLGYTYSRNGLCCESVSYLTDLWAKLMIEMDRK